MLENLRIAVRKQKKLILIFVLTIFLPALTLGVFGLRSIRNERYRLVRQEENEGRRAARLIRAHFDSKFEEIARALDGLTHDPAFIGKDDAAIREITEKRFAAEPLVGQTILLYGDEAPLFPRLLLPSGGKSAGPPKAVDPALDSRIRRAESLEFAERNPRAAADLYRELAARAADRNLKAELLAGQARCLRKIEAYEDAGRVYDRIIQEHSDAATPSGMPLSFLARLQIAECRKLSGDVEGAAERALDAYRELLEKPSPLSEDQLKTYMSLAGEAVEALLAGGKESPAAARTRIEFSELKKVGSDRMKERAAAGLLRTEIVPELESRLGRAESPLPSPDRISRSVGGMDLLLLAARIPGPTPGAIAGIFGVQLDNDRLSRDVLAEALGNAGLADDTEAVLADLAGRPLSPRKSPAAALPLATEYFRDNFPPWKIEVFQVSAKGPGGLDLRRNFFFWTILTLILVLAFGAFLIARTIGHEMEVLKIKSDFVSSVSHEFKTPLTSIKALMERLVAGKVRDEGKMGQYFTIIAQDTDKLTRLVNNLLDFSKIEEGKKEYIFAETDPARIAADEVERFNKERIAAGPPIRLEITGPVPFLWADADALSRALANLLSNAVKFTPAGKAIRVGLSSRGKEVVLEVKDEGIGIPPDETAKVFEKFFQGRNALEQSAKGTGLGLTLVKHIVEAHGGKILVESRLGRGSTFSMVFPVKS
jgi:signal transduction histidine kinase